MTQEDRKALDARLTDLSRRIDARIREFDARGGLSVSQDEFVRNLKQRHDSLRARLEAEVRDGAGWEALKDELALDLNSLIADFRDWEARLDAGVMKTGK